MSLVDRAEIAEDPVFQRRVRQALVTAAIAVAAEDPATANHEARRALVANILAAPNEWARVYAIGVSTHWGVGTGSTDDPSVDDTALEFAVNSMFDAYTEPAPATP